MRSAYVYDFILVLFTIKTGILRDKTIADKLMYIPSNDTQNYPFCRLQLVVETFNEPTNQNSIKVPKVIKLTNKKTLL